MIPVTKLKVESNDSIQPIYTTDLTKEERSRINRTSFTAANRITPQKRNINQIDESRLSEIPAVAARVATAAQESSLIQQPAKDLQPLIHAIDAQRAQLEDKSIPLPELPELDTLLGAKATGVETRSYLIQLNALVADILRLIARLNVQDNQKSDHMKKQYNILNNGTGDAIQKRGYANFASNVAALFVRTGGVVVGAALGMNSDRGKLFQQTMDVLGQQIPGLAGIFTTGYEVTQTKLSNKLSLLSADLQKTSQNDNSSWKSELSQALNEVKQLMTSASRAN